MKRMIALMMILCLLYGTASAESLRERCGAPEHFKAKYDSNTKKTTVMVDADVFIPDVDAVPLWDVSARDWTAVEGWAMAETLRPDGVWLRDEAQAHLPPDELFYEDHSADSSPGFDTRLTIAMSAKPEDLAARTDEAGGWVFIYNNYLNTLFGMQPIERSMEYIRDAGYNVPYFYPSGLLVDGYTGKDIPGQTGTMAEAVAQAEQFIAQFAPEYEFRMCYAIKGEICYHKEGSKSYRNVFYKTPAYLLWFTRSIAGIPITAVDNYVTFDLSTAPSPRYERIRVGIFNGRVEFVYCEHPCRIDSMRSEGSTLLPFDHVMEIFGAIAPLSIQNVENERGGVSNRLDVKEIRLGYMPLMQKDNPNEWVLRPVWDFFGEHRFAREHYAWPLTSYLTIDAIDGTVIDRTCGY